MIQCVAGNFTRPDVSKERGAFRLDEFFQDPPALKLMVTWPTSTFLSLTEPQRFITEHKTHLCTLSRIHLFHLVASSSSSTLLKLSALRQRVLTGPFQRHFVDEICVFCVLQVLPSSTSSI